MAGYEKSLKLVLQHLEQGETIKASVFGAFGTKLLGNDTIKNGVFVATERRVVFFSKGLFGFELESFPLKNISSINVAKKMMGHEIKVHASGNDASMKWIQKGDVSQFVQYVNENIGTAAPSPASGFAGQTDDIPSQIAKLATLKAQGILTEEEFVAKKTDLLSKM